MKKGFSLRKQGEKLFSTALLVIFIIVVGLGSLGDLKMLINSSTEPDIDVSLLDNMSSSVKAFQRKEEDTFYLLESIATFIALNENITDDYVLSDLTKLRIGKDFSRLTVADLTGANYSNNGIMQDISQKDFFKQAVRGENAVSNLFEPDVDGELSVVFAVPIYKNERPVGVLSCYYKTAVFEEILQGFVNYYEGEGTSYIVSQNGVDTIVCGNKEASSFYTLLRNSKMGKGMSVERFIAAVNQNKKGYIKYEMQGKRYYAAYMPSGINGWSLITTIPIKYINGFSNEFFRSALIIFTKILLIIFAVIWHFFFISYKRRTNLRNRTQEIEQLANNVPGGVFRYKQDDNQTLGYLSEGLLHIYNYDIETFRRVFENSFSNMIYEKDREHTLAEIAKQLAESRKRKVQYRIIDAQGKIRWVFDSGRIVTDKDGNEWFYVVLLGVTRFKSSEEQVRISEERYRILMEDSNAIVLESNNNDGTFFYTPNFIEKFGFEPKEFEYPWLLFPSDIVHKDDISVFTGMQQQAHNDEKNISGELRIKDKNGEYIWFSISNHIIREENGLPMRTICKIIDIDTEKRQIRHLEELSQRDPLTGLYNKGAVRTLISEHLKLYGGSGLHAMLFIDVDNFKAVNDSFGHLFGDKVITDIAAKLKIPFRDTDIVGRVGGDEFIIFIKNVRTKKFVCEKAQQVCEIMRTSYAGEENSYSISGSIGISFCSQMGTTYDMMVAQADEALYYAKEHGKNHYEVYGGEVMREQDIMQGKQSGEVQPKPDAIDLD